MKETAILPSGEWFEITEDELSLLMDVPACGCGNPAEVYDLYRTFLRATPHAGGGDWESLDALFAADERLAWVIVYVLDHIEATEHGGTARFAWRTEKGDRLLDLLDRYAEDYGRTPAASSNPR